MQKKGWGRGIEESLKLGPGFDLSMQPVQRTDKKAKNIEHYIEFRSGANEQKIPAARASKRGVQSSNFRRRFMDHIKFRSNITLIDREKI